MISNPRNFPPDASISLVAIEMNRRKFRHFTVVEPTSSAQHLVSSVSKYDVARGFPANLNPSSVEVVEGSLPRPVSLRCLPSLALTLDPFLY